MFMGADAEGAALAAADEVKLVIRECWEDALLNNDFSDDDDFFDIGGHSLLIADIMTSVGSHVGRRIPLRAFFEHSTINELSTHIRDFYMDERRDD